MMSSINIALLGFGTVGKGVFETIETHQERLQYYLGKPVKVVAVLVKSIKKHHLSDSEVLLTDNFEDVMQIPNLDIVIDAICGKEPGFTYIKRSIEKGCHVVTANKEMFAFHGQELLSLAAQQNVSVGFEATVAGGIPIIQTLRSLLKVNRITKVEGIINGTSNYILSNMRENDLPFEQVLADAQNKGYAEADPTNDIEGFDALYKALVLSQVVFGEHPEQENIIRKGISQITQEQIENAANLGLKFKHVVKLEKKGNLIQCKVQPVLLSDAHPFYSIEGVQNAVSINADIVGNITLTGPGAGKLPTASAVIEDLLHLFEKHDPVRLKDERKLEDQSEEEGQRLIFHQRLDHLCLVDSLDKVEQLHEGVFYIKGREADLTRFEQENDGVAIYPIEGNIQLLNKQQYANIG